MKWQLPWKTEIQETAIIDYKPQLSELLGLTEQFKGEVDKKDVKFPSDLGEEHPFDMKITEGLYKKFGLFAAIIDKYVDYVVGPGFFVTVEEPRAQKILDQFMKDVDFDTKLRAWTKEALMKGNGYLEIGGSKKEGIKGLKLLDAKYMYVKRDVKGKILSYNQYTGGFKGDKFDKTKVIPFKDPNSIAHVPFNVVGDAAYGLGIGYPNMQLMENLIRQLRDVHKIMERKANSPLHAKIGQVDGQHKIIPKPGDVTAFGKKMEIMSNKTDWATDPLVEFKVVDFGKMGEKFKDTLEFDLNMLLYAFQIPGVMLGMSNINKGVADVEQDAFQRRIQSIQAELEKIIEQQIFKRVLEVNGFDVDVEFGWGSPSILQVEGRMQTMTELITSPETGWAMRSMLEDEMIKLFKLDEDEWELAKLEQEKKEEEERKRLEAEAQPVVPGQNAKFPKAKTAPKPKQPTPVKTKAKPEKKIEEKKMILREKGMENLEYKKECNHCVESWGNINDINEWLGFNYKQYLGEINEVLSEYGFELLKAVNEIELEAGMLTAVQVEELRNILKDGFKKGKGLKEMSKAVDKKVQLKDLYQMSDGKIKMGASGFPILARSADKRAINIVRSEVTRVANAGAIEHYKKGGVDMIKHVASFGERTCPTCESLNGFVYEIGKEPGLPVHPMCRCTYAPVVELK